MSRSYRQWLILDTSTATRFTCTLCHTISICLNNCVGRADYKRRRQVATPYAAHLQVIRHVEAHMLCLTALYVYNHLGVVEKAPLHAIALRQVCNRSLQHRRVAGADCQVSQIKPDALEVQILLPQHYTRQSLGRHFDVLARKNHILVPCAAGQAFLDDLLPKWLT